MSDQAVPTDTNDPSIADPPPQPETGPGKNRGLARLLPRSRRARVIWAVAVLAVVSVGVWYVFFRPQTSASTQVTRQAMTISTTTLKTTVTATGKLQPEHQADLTFSSSGTVASVAVAVGDTVTAGQELATIDPAALKIAYQSATADLSAATSTLADLEDSSSSTTASINAAKANVQVKTNAVTTAKSNLANATMVAPFEGVVAEVNIAAGDTTGSASGGAGAGTGAGVGSTGTTSTSSAAIVLISKGTFNVSTSVSNSDLSSIKRGLQAVITPTGSSTAVYGTVSAVGVVASSASSSSGSTTFPVTIHVTGTHTDLLAGSSASVEIVTSQLTDVIAVPTSAITTSGGSSTVAKLVDGKEVATTVTTGTVVGSQTVITEGLEAGDQIMVSGVRVSSGNSTARAGSNSSQQQGFPQGDPMSGMQPPQGMQAPQGGVQR